MAATSGGGGLLGAAAASPLIVQNQTAGKTRGWLAATLSGSVAGAGVTWWATRNGKYAKAAGWLPGGPTAGVIGTSQAPRAHTGEAPIFGVGWAGPL